MDSRSITSANEATDVLRRTIPKKLLSKQECFAVLFLDTKNRTIGRNLIAIGTASHVQVHPRDVFREAIRRNASGIIVCHNHPSGELEFSEADRALTRRLNEASEIIGIQLLDHILLSKNGSLSMASSIGLNNN